MKRGARQDETAAPARRARAARPVAGLARSTRQLRVGEEIRHVLAGVFSRGELHDPELVEAAITVAEVRVSPDLKHATAFVSRFGRSDVAALLPALRRAAPHLRARLAAAMRNQRMTPELHFQADEALEYASHVNALLHRPEVARDLGPAAEPDTSGAAA